MGAFQAGSFQLYGYEVGVWARGPVTLTRGPSGPAYTRKRHRELLEAQRAAEEAERKAKELKKAADREAALAAAAEAHRLIVEARERQAAQWADTHRLATLHHALDAFSGALTIANTLAAITHLHHAVQAAQVAAAQDDDDEAIALLLLS